MTWKKPQRPALKITQCFNDGIANVFSVANVAAPGYQPVERLTPKISLHYEERKLGLQRYYEGLQNQVRIERVIRVPHAGAITSQDVVIDERGREYRVDLVQFVPDVYPPSDDLTLVRFRQRPEGGGGA